jgi:hypothetical protein
MFRVVTGALATAAVCFAITATTGFASGGSRPDSAAAPAVSSLERRVAALERKMRLQAEINALTITRLTSLESRRLEISDGAGGSTIISPGQWGYVNTGTCIGLDTVPVALSYDTDYPIWPGSVSHSFTGWRLAAYVPFEGHSAFVRAHPVCLRWG